MNEHDRTEPPASTPDDVTLPPSPSGIDVTLPPSPTTAATALSPEIPGYEILGELGRGGMGVVYRARQIAADRVVALKMILSGAHAGPDDLARFRTEAQAVARLAHPNIVQVYEVGEHAGLPYFSLEFCPGGSLEKKLDGTPLPPRESATLVRQLTEAMEHAHRADVVHRDLKPANVLLASGGREPPGTSRRPGRFDGPGGSRPPLAGFVPKITDFGLAKKLDEAGRTATGAIMGTPSYMAPEQAGGKPDEVGPLADVYALGAILYECLTGRPPFRAATPLDTVLLVVGAEPVPPRQLNPQVPRDLETICLKCLRKEPRRRYASAADLAADLGRFLDGEPIHARPVGAAERAWRWVRRNPAVAALVATVALSLVLGAAVAGYFAVRATDEARTAERQRAAAVLAREHADRESEKARQSEVAARRNLYVSHVNQAHLAWQLNQVARTHELLAGQDPRQTGGPDFRGFEWHYLDRLCHSEIRTIAHVHPVAAIAFSPDGTRLALAGGVYLASDVRTIISVRDAATGREVRPPLTGTSGPVGCLTFSPDGKHLASGPPPQFTGIRGAVHVWALASGKPVDTFVGGGAVAFSPDGTLLAAGSDGKRIRGKRVVLRDWTKRQDAHALDGHTASVSGLAFSPDGAEPVQPDRPARRPARPLGRRQAAGLRGAPAEPRADLRGGHRTAARGGGE